MFTGMLTVRRGIHDEMRGRWKKVVREREKEKLLFEKESFGFLRQLAAERDFPEKEKKLAALGDESSTLLSLSEAQEHPGGLCRELGGMYSVLHTT